MPTPMPMPSDYADVPGAPADAELDPHWRELTRERLLPMAYMPVTMAGAQPGWRRAAALVLIVMFVLATAGGVCLTYGPGDMSHLHLIR